jgi:CRP-like cAMP-binding protein
VRDYLNKIPCFGALSSEELAALSQSSRLTNYEAGQFVVRMGEAATHLFALCQGSVAMYFSKPNGKPFIMRTYDQGDLFFVSYALAGTRFAGYLEAWEDSSIICIPAVEVRTLIKDNPQFAQEMLKYLVSDNLRLTDTASNFLVDGRARLCRFLFQRALETGERCEGGIRFSLGKPKSKLAAQLDMSPETLSRMFAQLKEEKTIDLDDSMVFINNIRTLVYGSEGL